MLTRKKVLTALRRYDTEYPANDYPGGNRKSWLENERYNWALRHAGRDYTPKAIYSLISGIETRDIHSALTNDIFTSLGFDIIDKPGATRPHTSDS